MRVLLITRLLRRVGRWARKSISHTSLVAVVTPTDRPKSVCNRCVIELFWCVFCFVTLPFWHFCWCRGFCHRTESDLFLYVLLSVTFYQVQRGFHTFAMWNGDRQGTITVPETRPSVVSIFSICQNLRSPNLVVILRNSNFELPSVPLFYLSIRGTLCSRFH